ncbi:DUF123 domain-containing protein [Candidatus Fermentibacteria bacterium]|nr:DUF123 domain-containing protein [Candidatus Fermentibacteria bacterium]
MRLRVGALGIVTLDPGWHVYTGSARRNLAARLRRHLLGAPTLRWHIDYLSCRLRPVAWRVFSPDRGNECMLADEAQRGDHATRHPRGFGASDCGCGGHLTHSIEPPRWVGH